MRGSKNRSICRNKRQHRDILAGSDAYEHIYRTLQAGICRNAWTMRQVELSAYRFMWVVVLFDLPVDTAAARRAYTLFRKHLLKDGFTRMQYSVYVRHSSSEENAQVHISRVQYWVPDDGEVRILTITDKQFERMRIFWGKMRKLPPTQPKQLEFF